MRAAVHNAAELNALHIYFNVYEYLYKIAPLFFVGFMFSGWKGTQAVYYRKTHTINNIRKGMRQKENTTSHSYEEGQKGK